MNNKPEESPACMVWQVEGVRVAGVNKGVERSTGMVWQEV